jgi:hypothetical protein
LRLLKTPPVAVDIWLAIAIAVGWSGSSKHPLYKLLGYVCPAGFLLTPYAVKSGMGDPGGTKKLVLARILLALTTAAEKLEGFELLAASNPVSGFPTNSP